MAGGVPATAAFPLVEPRTAGRRMRSVTLTTPRNGLPGTAAGGLSGLLAAGVAIGVG